MREHKGMPPLYQQQPKEVTITWRFWSITTTTLNKMLIIIIIIILSKYSSWWRRLEDIFRLHLQDVLIKTNILASVICLQKTSSSRPIHSSWPYLFKTPSRRFQDVFKTSCQDVFKTSSMRLAKTSSRHLQGVFKTSSKHFQDVLERCLQDILKTYHQVVNCLPRSKIYLDRTSEKFAVSVENLQVWYALAYLYLYLTFIYRR